MYGLRIIELVITEECNYMAAMWNEVFTESTLSCIRKWDPFPSNMLLFRKGAAETRDRYKSLKREAGEMSEGIIIDD